MRARQLFRFTFATATVCILSLAAIGSVSAAMIHDTVDVFGVGCSVNPALDPGGIPLQCGPSVSWQHNIIFDENHLKEAILHITAEGIDEQQDNNGVGPEIDEVIVNGMLVGTLTNQNLYSALFNLQPGPGALAGITLLTWSIFDVTAYLVSGINTITVNVDPTNWVLEIETSELWVTTPEPTTLALMGLAVAGLGFRRRKAA